MQACRALVERLPGEGLNWLTASSPQHSSSASGLASSPRAALYTTMLPLLPCSSWYVLVQQTRAGVPGSHTKS